MYNWDMVDYYRALQRKVSLLASHTVLMSLAVLICLPVLCQQPPGPENSRKELARTNLRWLLGQVTPNHAVPSPTPARRRLLISYDLPATNFPYRFHRSTTYDNSLAAIAFVITGRSDEASFTLHSLGRLVRKDGSLWFSYNTANSWPNESDHEGALVRTGALGWVGYAFTFYLAHGPPCDSTDKGCAREFSFFRQTAVRLADYLLSLRVEDPTDPRYGLLRLGYGNFTLAYDREFDKVVEQFVDGPARGVSTENNISAWLFFRQLEKVTGEKRWGDAAEAILEGLVRGAWNNQIGQFNQGFHADGRPDPARALDCASWGALMLHATGDNIRTSAALEAIEDFYASRHGKAIGYRPYFGSPIYKNFEVGRYYFPERPRKQWQEIPLVWAEGSLGVALAYLRMGRTKKASSILAGLELLQGEGKGLRYSSRDIPYHMSNVPSVAAAAWLVIVSEALEGNPVAQEFWN